jgi:hypothetical protein
MNVSNHNSEVFNIANNGNVGIGITNPANKLEVNGNINIAIGSKYKIGGSNLAYSNIDGIPPVSSKWTNATDGATNIYYNAGNVGIGTISGITNKLEVNGNINIPTGSTFRINNQPLNYTHLEGSAPASSKWTNATDVTTNIYYSTGNVGIGTISGITNRLEVNGNINISAGSKYKINGYNLAFSNIDGTLSYTSFTDKPDSQIVSGVDVPLTNEPTINPSVIVANAYYPRTPATNSATWTDSGYTVNVKVSDPVLGDQGVYLLFNNIITSQDYYHSLSAYTGTGNTYSGSTRFKGYPGIAISVDFGRSIYPKGMRIAPRPLQGGYSGNDFINGAPKAFRIYASDDASCWNDNVHSSWMLILNQTTGLTYTNEQYTMASFTANLPKYRYYTMVVLSTIGNYGGDSGGGYMIFSEWNIWGDEKINAIPEGNPITHKTLNFAYSPNYPWIYADINNLIVWYKFDDPTNLGKDEFNRRNLINTSVTTTSDLIGTSASFTNETYLSIANFNLNFDNTIITTGISFSFWFKLDAGSEYYGHLFTWGTHNTLEKFALMRNNLELKLAILQGISVQNEFNILAYNTWIHLVINIDTSRVLTVYQNTTLVFTLTLTPSSYSGLTTSSPFTLGRANGVNMHDYRGGIEDFRIYNKVLTSAEISYLYSISTQNTYTLSVQEGTSIQVNNGTAQYLSGNYTISVGATQSSVLGQSGQTDPYPLTDGSTIAIRYSMLQRITSTINIKKDGLIKYVPASGTNPTTGSWNIIDIDTQPLTQFAGNLPISRTDGNLPANRLENIDMSKVATGNLDWSRISSQPLLTDLGGTLSYNSLSDKPDSQILSLDVPLTNEPTYTPQAFTTERMYPPVRNFTAATTIVSGQTYGNGNYVVSYSSFLSPYEPFKCFNTSDTIGGHWINNYTNGNYNGSAFIVSGYLGDWLKIQLPVAIKLTSFGLKIRPDFLVRAPKDFKIYGSNDNITWVELVNKTDAVYNANASTMYEQTTPEITTTYTYYGLVVNKLPANVGGVVLNFDEWYIYGQETIVNAAIPEGNPVTHKTLNFAYDLTKYAEYLAQQKTGVGGWRIVRFLSANTGRWYQGNYINTSTFTIPTIGTPYNYTNEWAVSFGTFDEMFFATFDMTYWLQCLKTSVLGDYADVARPVIKSSERNYAHSVKWFNRAVTTVNQEDPWISINDHLTTPALMLYGENNNSTNFQTLLNAYGGMCVLVRDSTSSTTIPNPNQYTLSVQSGTSIQVNNGAAQYLSGNYTISVGATQSSVLGQSGQTDPYPLTNGSNIAIRYSMLQRITSTDIITQPILNSCNYLKIVDAPINVWKNIISTQKNTIYYGAPVKIGGNNAIDVGNDYILEVLGNVRIKGTITQGWIGDGSTSGDGGILQSGQSGQSGTVYTGDSTINGNFVVNINSAERFKITDAGVYFQNDTWHYCLTGNQRFNFAPNGTTYIRGHGSTPSSIPIEFRNATDAAIVTFTNAGDLRAIGNISAYYSDERLKTITEYVSDVLPILSKINVFKYNCNDLAASYGYDKNKKEIGLSAQEIQKYYPEVVSIAPFDTKYDEETKELISKSGEKYLTLNYERLVPILLQGIKELKHKNNLQQNEIDDLKQKTNMQQNEIGNLKLRLTRLELLL